MDEGSPTCYSCGKGRLSISSEPLDIPHFGEVDLIAISCSVCGYRSTDVIPARAGPPSTYKLILNSERSLSARVVRSSTSTVLIPELGARIDPGIASEGFITNAEGILERFLGILNIFLRDIYNTPLEDDHMSDIRERTARALAIIDSIEACRAGRRDLTLTIKDPFGHSAIIGEGLDIERMELEEGEIRDLLDRTGN